MRGPAIVNLQERLKVLGVFKGGSDGVFGPATEAGVRAVQRSANLNPDGIVISPGPGRPDDAGVSLDVIRQLGPEIPVLGVCLGHQSMGQVFGGDVVSAPELMHGNTSPVFHKNIGVFENLESPVEATRYHSLVIDKATCPDCLEVTAWVEDGTIMGVRHRDYPHIEGVQFHPESILPTVGKTLLENWLRMVQQFQQEHSTREPVSA